MTKRENKLVEVLLDSGLAHTAAEIAERASEEESYTEATEEASQQWRGEA